MQRIGIGSLRTRLKNRWTSHPSACDGYRDEDASRPRGPVFELPAFFRCDLPNHSRVVPNFQSVMAADQPGCCAQRLLIIPADYTSGSADRALIVEKVDPVSDHAHPSRQGSKLTRNDWAIA